MKYFSLRVTNAELLTALKALLIWARNADAALEQEFGVGKWEEPPEFAQAEAAIAKAEGQKP